MISFIKKVFGDSSERSLKKLWPVVELIKNEEAQIIALSDEELSAKTDEFKARIHESVEAIEAEQTEIKRRLRIGTEAAVAPDGSLIDDVGEDAARLTLEDRHELYDDLDKLSALWLDTVEETLEEMLPEAFAVVKETCRRMKGESWIAGGQEVVWDMVPYDVQLLGGVAIHLGKIAEMKTGEGKTLVAVAPVYLNALVGRGVHLVTVNPYLAQRDSEWMGPVFARLGLSVDVIDRYEPHSEARRKAYEADITYGTNNEFGFDYLRDNSFVVDPNQLVQRGHHFAIVDEVDSVLIDEARTPLIISGPVPQSDEDRFSELKPAVERLVTAQKKLVAQLVSDAERLLKERDAALEKGDKKEAAEIESEAGLSVLRANRGFQRNPKLRKLLGEPGVAPLLQKTEFYYLQDNAKHMPFVDDELYFSLDEKGHALEMTEKGRGFTAKAAGQSEDLFVLPDIGEEVAKFESELGSKRDELVKSLESDTSITEEKRAHKLDNDLSLIRKELDEKRRNLYTTYSDRAERLHAIEQLLKAYMLYEKDDEYIVQDGKVMIVDTHTGRVLSGRRYSDGLHQAIEAKENVKIQAATQTYATITLQNYFRLYDKLAGMTGTAETEAEEFNKTYKMEVVVVPTNVPIARADLDDLVFKTKREKYNAVLDKIREYHEKGQPVLVGTTSVEVSETVSRMLKRGRIPHNVLNAKRDRAKQEALIVAEAGQKGGVTIATNMAGRGTDIKLAEGVRELGGLAIIGTERHESRRIDLQLRGRAGRQGDSGESQFYVSLDDNLMRLFSSDRVARVMDKMNLEEGAVITHPWVNKSIERAQSKVEQNNFSVRKRQLEYDDVLNAQREVIYDRRMHALRGERLQGDLLEMMQDVIRGIVDAHHGDGNLDEMREELLRTISLDVELDREEFLQLGEDGVAEKAFDVAVEFYNNKRASLSRPFYESMQQMVNANQENQPDRVFVDFTDGRRVMRAVAAVDVAIETRGQEVNDALERSALLSFIDSHWTEHLRNLDEVKEGIGLRAFGQRDPLIEYKMEAFKLFAEMMEAIGSDFVSFVMRAGPLVDGRRVDAGRQAAAPKPRMDSKRARTTHETASPSYGVGGGNGNAGRDRDPTAKAQPVVVEDRVGRNDPCPCGSGKKYKHCHG
ncbi:MAG: preprotein translocase subunit SecA [Rhodothermales bacterium]|nr:preprotein translocase subunit SecA [Rhodothermales bacterium]